MLSDPVKKKFGGHVPCPPYDRCPCLAHLSLFYAPRFEGRQRVAVVTSEGSEFQTDGAEHRKACFAS